MHTKVERLERHLRALLHRTLSRARRLAQQYQARPPVLLLLLDLGCILASIGAAIFLLRAHASILPLGQMCEANVTIGAPPCSQAAAGGSGGEAGSAAGARARALPLACVSPQDSAARKIASASTCSEDAGCKCGCAQKGYLYGCYECCPDTCVVQVCVFVCLCVCVCVNECVFVCVCVRERERD